MTPEPAAPKPPPAWWREFDRRDVLAAIEEASGAALDVNDPLPDSLIANAQALGLTPADLRMWIYDGPARKDWDMHALALWARRYGLGATDEADAPKAAA